MLVGGAAVRPNVCPQPTTEAPVRLCVPYPPLSQGQGLTVEWCDICLGYLHNARLVVLLRWDLAKGVLARADLRGAGGAGGAGLATLLLVVPCGRGPAALGGRQTRRRDGS